MRPPPFSKEAVHLKPPLKKEVANCVSNWSEDLIMMNHATTPTGPMPPRIIDAFNRESIQLNFSKL